MGSAPRSFALARAACRRVGGGVLLAALAGGSVAAAEAPGAAFAGRITGPGGAPVVGAQVTFHAGDPIHATTVMSDDEGRYRTPPLRPGEAYAVRVRRLGWRDLRREGVPLGAAGARLDLALEREDDPAELAAQLPANRWLALLLARIDDPGEREEFVRQCTYCHQQASLPLRVPRDTEQWQKVLSLMARMGGTLSADLRARVPELFTAAYDPATAVPALTARMHEPDFAPPPPPEVRRAVVEEWELGGRASMQHDLAVHPDGRIYSVDMLQDQLYRLDPAKGEGWQEAFAIPQGGLPIGGVFGGLGAPSPPNANSHVGPHSLQVAPDGAVWITLALGNQLARFDPRDASWRIFPLEEGFYPHTLRFDARGRIWYTVAASNHVGRLDPASGEHRWIALPTRTFGQRVAIALLPAFLWLNRQVDLGGGAAGEGMQMPVPYGIDVAPDGGVWFSQLNEHRIGRIDPDTLAVELIETPFTAPRRLRFDSQGRLWIPGFSSGLVSRFDPGTREFRSYELPVEPRGTETPYALNVDRRTDAVWICGTNSDSLIRFEPAAERFTVYPMPTRVTYTREIDFDAEGRVWTSNSNLPTWQIEYGFPRVIRLDPDGAAGRAAALAQGQALR
jgi:streptogramin lyase